VVGFDTTILPGREGSVTEEVAMAKVHEGAFTKCATVTSNAKNKSELRLCLKGLIKVPVSVSPSYIQLKKNANGVIQADLIVTSEKPDLQVKTVAFTSNSQPPAPGAGPNAWQNKLPIYMVCKLTKPEKPKDDGSWEYKLVLTCSGDLTQNQFGEFVILTNHPELPELKENGMIDIGVDQKK
jgi:hypothetical protein